MPLTIDSFLKPGKLRTAVITTLAAAALYCSGCATQTKDMRPVQEQTPAGRVQYATDAAADVSDILRGNWESSVENDYRESRESHKYEPCQD